MLTIRVQNADELAARRGFLAEVVDFIAPRYVKGKIEEAIAARLADALKIEGVVAQIDIVPDSDLPLSSDDSDSIDSASADEAPMSAAGNDSSGKPRPMIAPKSVMPRDWLLGRVP